jgi:glutaconate CoA-transferase subunit A
MYDVDEEHMRYMNAALATCAGTRDYLSDFVERYRDVDSYLDMIGRDRLAELSKTATAFLLDPYRRWIMPAAQIAQLQSDAKAT